MSGRRISLPTAYDSKLHYNCFIEATVPPERRQACFQELRRRGQIWASHYLPDGRLQLLVSDLHACLDAHRTVIDSLIREANKEAGETLATLKRESGELATMSREGITTFVYIEPEPIETVRLDVCIRTANETIRSMKTEQETLTVFRTQYERLLDNKTNIPPETTIMYKSRLADYWHFLFIHGLDEVYIYGQNDRRVIVPYCVDESGSVLLTATCSIRRELFPQSQELDESDLRQISMVYTYRPYAETIDELLTTHKQGVRKKLFERWRTRRAEQKAAHNK